MTLSARNHLKNESAKTQRDSGWGFTRLLILVSCATIAVGCFMPWERLTVGNTILPSGPTPGFVRSDGAIQWLGGWLLILAALTMALLAIADPRWASEIIVGIALVTGAATVVMWIAAHPVPTFSSGGPEVQPGPGGVVIIAGALVALLGRVMGVMIERWAHHRSPTGLKEKH